MNRQWMQMAILRVASLLAPREQRAEWVKEWQSELWYIEPRGAVQFCLGAFRDALWMRRNHESLEGSKAYLESPIRCLAYLVALAAVSLVIAVWLPAPEGTHMGVHNLPLTSGPMLLFTYLMLPAAVATGWIPAHRYPISWQGRLRRVVFLALKIALVQPMMFCGFIAALSLGRNPLALLGFSAGSFLALRWIFADQRRRCPVCLRLLTEPVRIGTSSHTFLEWYGAESTCSRGHGLLHVAEGSASDSRSAKWLSLGDSWTGIFSGPAEARRR
jgi:hypothetical protein